MKKALLLLLASAVVVGGGIFAAGARRASATFDDGGYLHITNSSLAPESQTQEIRGVAPLLATVTLEECVGKGSPQPTSDNLRCESAPSTPSSDDINWLMTQGIAGRMIGDSGPDAGQVIGFAFSNVAVSLTQNETVLVITLSAIVPWPNTAGQPGTDMVHFEVQELSKLVGALAPQDLISNSVQVRWIKTGGIDTGIFVRRTPVVEQAAAPAAPEVQPASSSAALPSLSRPRRPLPRSRRPLPVPAASAPRTPVTPASRRPTAPAPTSLCRWASPSPWPESAGRSSSTGGAEPRRPERLLNRTRHERSCFGGARCSTLTFCP